MIDKNDVTAIWQNFLKLINKRTGEFLVSYEEQNGSKLEFPEPTIDTLRPGKLYHIAIPGFFGGYSYFFEEHDNNLVMYADLTSRWHASEEDYEYFEVTTDGYYKLKGDKRGDLADKILALSREHLREHFRKIANEHLS